MPPVPPPARQGLLGLLLPRSAIEWKVLAAVGAVRFGLVPATSFFVVQQCVRAGLFPADPTCILSVLIQVRFKTCSLVTISSQCARAFA